MLEYCKEKLIERGLSKGRITRGKTIVYYYNCTMMTCGCMKKWRLRSSQSSLEFLEEETSEEHSNHNKHLRFEGRGISFAQEAIVEEAMSLNLFKTTEIVNHFRYVAANGLKNGEPSFAHPLFKARSFFYSYGYILNILSLNNRFIHTFIHSYIHTFIHSYIHTFIHSYIHTFILLSARLYICSLIYLFINLIRHWLTHSFAFILYTIQFYSTLYYFYLLFIVRSYRLFSASTLFIFQLYFLFILPYNFIQNDNFIIFSFFCI